jgi:hypothetical protein
VTHISRNTFSLYRTSIQGNGILTTYRAVSAFNVDRFIKVGIWNENDALNEGVYQISLYPSGFFFWNGRKDSSFRELIMDRTNDIWTCNHSIQCKSLFHIRSSCRKHWLIACEVPFHYTSGCHIVVGKTNFVLQTWSIANSSHNSSYDWSYTTLIHVINLRPRWSLLNPRP